MVPLRTCASTKHAPLIGEVFNPRCFAARAMGQFGHFHPKRIDNPGGGVAYVYIYIYVYMYACISLASAQDAVAYVPGHLSPGPCSHEAIPRFLPARDPLGTIPGTRGSRLTSSSSPLFPATPDSSPGLSCGTGSVHP